MPHITLAEFKARQNWPQLLNMDSSDPRWLQLLNNATQRLLNMGLWLGTTQKYAVCVTDACLTWPRQFESILAMDVCGVPMPLRSQWHEFLENGPGLSRLGGCSTWNAFDRGSGFAMYDDISTSSIIRLYPQYAADAGKTVTIRGLDDDYQPVLTNNGNTVGEVLTLASPYVDSTTIWGKQVIRQVIKQATRGYVRAYSYDATLPVPPAAPGPNDTPLTDLAVWEPTETLPNYRRSYIPTLAGRCCDGSSGCNRTSVTVMAKIAFIPISSDLDFLPIGNAPALALAMKSVMLEERGDMAGSLVAMYGVPDPLTRRNNGGAIRLLDDELAAWQGPGLASVVRLMPANIAGAGVLNMI